MNRVYIFVYSFIGFMALICLAFICLVSKPIQSDIDKDELLIYPSNPEYSRFNVEFWNGESWNDVTPEQVAMLLKTGRMLSDTNLVIYPQSEYQLTLEANSIVIEDFDRKVCEISYDSIGYLKNILLEDNE